MAKKTARTTKDEGLAGLKTGFILDYVTGQQVKATPEEVEAVQIFSRRLVEDYGYPKNHLQTRPQYRVRKSPSDESKTYPVDIAVFKSANRLEGELSILVECKQKNQKVGVTQLKLYMDMSAAEIGVWFNGDEHEYILKVYHRDRTRTYESLPNIPRFGQRVEDIGRFKRKDLVKPSNLKSVFRDIRYHLAGMTTGITRDEALAQEIINLLFCKIYDERDAEPDDMVKFRAGVGESGTMFRHESLNCSRKSGPKFSVMCSMSTIPLIWMPIAFCTWWRGGNYASWTRIVTRLAMRLNCSSVRRCGVPKGVLHAKERCQVGCRCHRPQTGG